MLSHSLPFSLRVSGSFPHPLSLVLTAPLVAPLWCVSFFWGKVYLMHGVHTVRTTQAAWQTCTFEIQVKNHVFISSTNFRTDFSMYMLQVLCLQMVSE